MSLSSFSKDLFLKSAGVALVVALIIFAEINERHSRPQQAHAVSAPPDEQLASKPSAETLYADDAADAAEDRLTPAEHAALIKRVDSYKQLRAMPNSPIVLEALHVADIDEDGSCADNEHPEPQLETSERALDHMQKDLDTMLLRLRNHSRRHQKLHRAPAASER